MLFYSHLIIIQEQQLGKILLWLQERVKRWIKPATSVLIIGCAGYLYHPPWFIEKNDAAIIGGW